MQRVADELKPATAAARVARVANELIELCNGLPKQARRGSLMICANVRMLPSPAPELAGETFSVADACLLPFLQRVESEGLLNTPPTRILRSLH